MNINEYIAHLEVTIHYHNHYKNEVVESNEKNLLEVLDEIENYIFNKASKKI